VGVRATRVTVTDTATPLNAVGTDYHSGTSALIRNRGAVAVYVGKSDVTTTTGYQLDPGEAIPADLGDGEILYGRCATSRSAVCHVLETSV
jgi:hypothetical protein